MQVVIQFGDIFYCLFRVVCGVRKVAIECVGLLFFEYLGPVAPCVGCRKGGHIRGHCDREIHAVVVRPGEFCGVAVLYSAAC